MFHAWECLKEIGVAAWKLEKELCLTVYLEIKLPNYFGYLSLIGWEQLGASLLHLWQNFWIFGILGFTYSSFLIKLLLFI